jgi:hypothetical protein
VDRPLSNAQKGESLVLVSESDIAVDDRFGRESGRIYLTGIQALARLRVESRRADLRANFNSAAAIWAMRREREQAFIQRFPRKPDDE